MKRTINKDLTPSKDLVPNGRVLSLIYSILFMDLEDFRDSYMIEVELENAEEKLISGDFICHDAIHQLKSCAEHLYDEKWIVLHRKDEIFQQIDINKVKKLLRQVICDNETKEIKLVKKEE